ncbi:MAG TPA: GAF domain-containing protein [Candidatus Sulfotelmatobacter sp.]|nr:GAF domain-containing protein [Candidatus Sulfotelmatobacter sp.]
MNTRDNVDRQSFQSLLANAFSVQQSGMSPESLAAIIEIQRRISEDDIDADCALSLIADRARAVADASGIGIALLQGNQLVRRAGTGIASQFVGCARTAVLSASQHSHPRREILRVENAKQDSRIEADICRQFEAEALLLVPIYRERVMIGVLEILFQEPHHFQEPEVRTYQLMATLAGDASTLPAQVERREAQPTSTVPRALWRMLSEIQQLGMARQRTPQPRPEPVVESRSPGVWAVLRQWSPRPQLSRMAALARQTINGVSLPKMSLPRVSLPALQWPDMRLRNLRWPTGLSVNGVSLPKMSLPRVSLPAVQWPGIRLRNLRWPTGLSVNPRWRKSLGNVSWNLAAVSLLIVLAIAVSIAHRDSLSRVTAPTPQTATAAAATVRTTPSEPLATAPVVKPVSANPTRDAKPLGSPFKRIRIGKDEVDYVADDVTIRHFRSGPEPTKARALRQQVNIGNDVTVRYFNSPPATTGSQSSPAGEQTVKN